ncbi:protein phosphatase 2C domain-containing protein [Ruminococcus sp. YE78]|nr:protein phosphatase 2C domain-containing protein [Ruminococcus sp. YE78]
MRLRTAFREYMRDIEGRASDLLGGCLKVSFATDTGAVRDHNEDSFYIGGRIKHKFGESEVGEYCEPCSETYVYGVFDGLGGEDYGEVASAIAAELLERFNARLKAASADMLDSIMTEYADRANAAILDMLAEHNSDCGGSTFTAIIVKDGVAYPYYIGDSRIYLYRDGALTLISHDQTLAQRLVDGGYMTEEEADGSYESHVLVSFLGEDSDRKGLEVQRCEPVKLEQGTVLMMCSDGLSDMCSSADIAEVISEHDSRTARRLADRAVEKGGYDNVTVVTIKAK